GVCWGDRGGGVSPARPPGWARRALLPLTCVLLLVLSLWWAHRLTYETERWPGLRLEQAQARVSKAEQPPAAADAGWQPLTLPDNWKLTRAQEVETVWYRIPFNATGMDSPAVLIPRLASAGQVWLNGSRLWDGRPSSPGSTFSWNAPLLLMLPTGLLHAQGDVLEIQVQGLPRYRAGLSQLQLAPHAQLAPLHDWRYLWQRDGALISSMVSLVAGVLMLLMWLRSERDPMYLCFGLATVAWAARNSIFYLDELPVRIETWALLVQGGHAWFATLFGLFVLRFTDTPWRWMRALLWAFAIVSSVFLLGGEFVEPMRSFALPGLALYLVLLGLLLRKGWRECSTESALMAATTLTFLALSARDVMLLNSQLPYDAYHLSHYIGVLMLISTAWGLVARLVAARQRVEQLNVELERRVQQRTEALQAANAAKTRFLAAASHDLRQPVVAIGLLIGLVRERVSAPEVRHMIDRAHEAVNAMEVLLQGLLDLSRFDSGAVEPRPQAVPLQAVFDAIEAHEGAVAQARKLRLRFRPTALSVRADPLLLDQLLRNLVGNALRYTERGGVLVAARCRGTDEVRLQVWDSGRGIPPERHAEVFEEFVQLDNPARDRLRGLGLGLAIVTRCAALLHTRVVLKSVVGRGSCFSLVLPRLETPPPLPRPRIATASPLATHRLLVVDDDEAVRVALCARLEAWGAEVVSLDGLPAVEQWLADGHPAPHVLLTDHRLPVGNGMQVIEAVRARHAELPALMITGNTSPEDIAAFAVSGIPVLHKPFQTEALLAAIERALTER
ncbi:MAG TPA: hybrid sensor histidine kinase/response regulator, partial [Rhizobacter sp.]|nr:hybrid sensor histidine kinase/response regulator [Rhizobacter sp.]